MLTRPLGQAGRRWIRHPLNPVCPAGVLLLPAEEAGAACSTEPLRPAWGAAACGGGCGVVGATL
jgi:hypothetical protein